MYSDTDQASLGDMFGIATQFSLYFCTGFRRLLFGLTFFHAVVQVRADMNDMMVARIVVAV